MQAQAADTTINCAEPPIVAPQRLEQVKQQVADGVGSIFAGRYAHELTISALLQSEALKACARMRSGEKKALLRL